MFSKPFSNDFTLKKLVLPITYSIFLLLSSEKRYIYVLKIAKTISPLAAKFSYIKVPHFALDTFREYLTAKILNSLTFHGVEFNPALKVNGAEAITSEGAIFIGAHFYLNFIFMRYLYDIGRQPTVFLLTGTDEWRILGTKVPFEIISNKPMSFNYVRHLTSKGKIVAAAIDHSLPLPGWKKLNCAETDLYVNDALIKLAERTRTPIFFFDTSIDKNDDVVLNIAKATTNDTSIVLDEFANFISLAINRRK